MSATGWTPAQSAALIALANGPLVAFRGGFAPPERLAAVIARSLPAIQRQTIGALSRRHAVKIVRPRNVRGAPLTAALTPRGRTHVARLLAARPPRR